MATETMVLASGPETEPQEATEPTATEAEPLVAPVKYFDILRGPVEAGDLEPEDIDRQNAPAPA